MRATLCLAQAPRLGAHQWTEPLIDGTTLPPPATRSVTLNSAPGAPTATPTRRRKHALVYWQIVLSSQREVLNFGRVPCVL